MSNLGRYSLSLRFLAAQAFAVLILAVAPVLASQAQTVSRASLGELVLEFATIEAVSTRPGASRLMEVATLPGDGLALQLPFAPNRLEQLVDDGALVAADTAVARIYGPELEHWVLAARLLKERFEDARKRYERNERLYEQQGLSADKWQLILDRYHTLKIEQQHTEHVMSWLTVEEGDAHEPTAILRAPEVGHVMFAATSHEAEPIIAYFVPPQSLRFSMQVPREYADSALAMASDNCELPVARRDGRVNGYSRRVWSEPLGDCLPAQPGLRLSGVPVYGFDGYAVPRDAVLSYRGETYLALELPSELELVPVAVAGEDHLRFFVSSERDLRGARVLVRSNSALQGLLLGLGQD
ncbi:hypothetical protein N9H37_03415 [Congregibacter sp.]|nr:hypothetical protein [Congregibacter sp.]MDA8962383.1 hypothetical protein [Congregibacter sp.]